MVDDSRKKKSTKQSPVSNPFVGAIAYGLSCAGTVALGATIRDNNVHEEAMTVLVGGVVCGGIFGFVGMLILVASPSMFKIVDPLFQLGAVFSLPAMGHLIQNYDSYKYTEIIIDMFVGGSIIGGGICCSILFVFLTVGSVFGKTSSDVANISSNYTKTIAVIDNNRIFVSVAADIEAGQNHDDNDTPVVVANVAP